MLMKDKYFELTDETSFRLWMFSLALEELKKKPHNTGKVSNLLGKVATFANGNWVKYNASAEQKDDLNKVLTELQLLAAD